MFLRGIKDYDKTGKEVMTGLFAGSAMKDGELFTTNNGKELGSVSVILCKRQDGTTAWLNVKGWGSLARKIARLSKGDHFLAAGRLENRDYNGKTYTDLVADLVLVPESTESGPRMPVAPGGVNVSASDFQDGDFAPIEEEDGELPF